MRAIEKAVQHRQVEQPVPALHLRHAAAAAATHIGQQNAQPVDRKEAEAAPQPEAGVGAALFETDGNDEPTDHQEEEHADLAQANVLVRPASVGGLANLQTVLDENEQGGQATGDVEESEPIPGGSGAWHGASSGRGCGRPLGVREEGGYPRGKRNQARPEAVDGASWVGGRRETLAGHLLA